jgi:hypothetical protein
MASEVELNFDARVVSDGLHAGTTAGELGGTKNTLFKDPPTCRDSNGNGDKGGTNNPLTVS